MLFISMLAFQLAGALVLLLNCIKGNRTTVIKNCFPGSNVIERDDNNVCTIPKEKLRESSFKIYLNIVAFADLVIGYAIAAFSPVATYSTKETVIGVTVATIALLVIEYFGSKMVSNLIYNKDKQVDYDELKENGVDTFATNKEVEDMFNDIFGNED